MSSLPPSSACRKYAIRSPRTLFAIILFLAVIALVFVPPMGAARAGGLSRGSQIAGRSQLYPSANLVSSTIAISQVYGAGGNAGAVLLNDYIELFNLGSNTVSVSGWSVQYASATGTGNFASNAITSLSGSLPPGGYYLVKVGSGGSNGVALPAADATGTVNISGTAGKVALVNTTTGLACNGGSTPCPAGELAKIVDLVGYGNANFFEGSGAAPTLSPTTAAFRGAEGCTESDNNSTDFTTGAPNPRNSSDDIHTCGGVGNPSGVGAANPNSVVPGGSTLLTVSVTPGSAPPSTGITVTGNLAVIGGSATQQFFDNATNGDVTAGDNVFSWQATVAAGTTGGVKSLPISIADAEARQASTNISLTIQAPANPAVTGGANPSTIAQGGTVTLTGNVSSGILPASTGLAVTADLSSIGGLASQQFYDDATHGDAVANNNVFTFQTVVPPATTTGIKNLPVTVTDAQGRLGSGTITLNVTGPAGPHDPSEHLLMGNPNGATADVNFPDNYLMMKLQYALSYNNTRRIPNWTSWHLDSTWRGSASRQDDFRGDTTLPPGFNQVQGTDYSGSGFDRGHMCPSADRTSSVPDNSATFLMTNMVPQAPGNNQGPWAVLENDLRAFLSTSEIYIVSGGTGVGGVGTGGAANVLPSGVTVPQKTWKVAMILPIGDNDVSRVDGNTRTIAVIMPNIDSIRSDQWKKYLATVDQVEALTGYDFYSNVPVAIQDVFEAKLDAANDTAPVTTGQAKTTLEDQSVAVTLSATDFNVNNVFTYKIATPPAHGSLSGSGANLTYSPNLHYFGPDSFTFRANDGALDSNTSTVNITVTETSPSQTATISGHVIYAIDNAKNVPNVTMTLSGSTPPQTTLTGADGNYSLLNVTKGKDYILTPSKSSEAHDSSITASDASHVARYDAGLESLTANQLIAADVSNNGVVTAFDASQIARYQASMTAPGSIAGSWKFLPASLGFPNLSADQTNQNFQAILVGDVTGNWLPPSGPVPLPLKATAASPVAPGVTIVVSLPFKQDAPGPTTIPISVGDTTGQGIGSFAMDISFDSSVLQPQATPYDTAGTLSSGWLITPNTATTGHLILNGFSTTDMAGQGIMLNLKFNVVGAGGAQTPLTWVNFTFNEGNPGDTDINGQFTVGAPTAANGRISGQIVTSSGQPVSGATVTVSGGARTLKTITDSEGRYQVVNVETNRVYTVIPARANYTFAPAERSFSLLGDKTDAVFTGTSSGDAVNPVDTAEYFVRQQYLDILGREPDQGGFEYWSAQLQACGGAADCVQASRVNIASAFFIEQEFRQSGAFIYNLYREGLGRRPQYPEYAAERRTVVGGATLEAQQQAFAAAFVARAEFASRYAGNTTAESFVDALLANVRQASGVDLSSERASLIARYQTGTSQNESRTLVLREVTESAAVREANYNGAFVAVEYFGYLHRNPEPAGYDFWLNVLNQSGSNGNPTNYRGMVCSFITSTEYQRRFSAVVSHSNAECGQ